MAASSDGGLIGEIRTMGKADDATAKALLKRIVGHVIPIMRKRQWKVGVLTEFFPANANLLGLNYNRGQEIRIRLRPADREAEFLPFESLLGTMLHELTHIVHGPHDARFYKLLDELNDEYDANVIKGTIEPEGFVGQGVQLGGQRVPPPQALRGAAAAAAEKRRVANVLLGQEPQRLGSAGAAGAAAWKQKSPGLMAAEAAERRLLDAIWCGNREDDVDPVRPTSGSSQTRSGSAGPQERPTSGALQGRSGSAGPQDRGGPQGRGGSAGPQERGGSAGPAPPPKRPRPDPVATQPPPATPRGPSDGFGDWTCPYCTYVDKPLWLQCGACAQERVL